MNLSYAPKQKIDKYFSLIGDKMTELHYQSALMIYFSEKARVHPHLNLLYQTPSCPQSQNIICIILYIFANSMPKTKSCHNYLLW